MYMSWSQISLNLHDCEEIMGVNCLRGGKSIPWCAQPIDLCLRLQQIHTDHCSDLRIVGSSPSPIQFAECLFHSSHSFTWNKAYTGQKKKKYGQIHKAYFASSTRQKAVPNSHFTAKWYFPLFFQSCLHLIDRNPPHHTRSHNTLKCFQMPILDYFGAATLLSSLSNWQQITTKSPLSLSLAPWLPPACMPFRSLISLRLSVRLILPPSFAACGRDESDQSIRVSWAEQWCGKTLTF